MYYAHATLGIILSSCLGGAAAMLILISGHGFAEMFQLFLVTIACLGFNTTILACLKHKIVFNALIISILVSTFFITYHLILL
jgi:hypothetical protein